MVSEGSHEGGTLDHKTDRASNNGKRGTRPDFDLLVDTRLPRSSCATVVKKRNHSEGSLLVRNPYFPPGLVAATPPCPAWSYSAP